ncbi:hypothetical protein JL720_12033 [Aureococcus anophagefferens]|nr:hypothetical protein JL720_12033 [Aureococcus anophagefferens]
MSKRWWQEESAAEAGFDFETANDGGDDDDADYVKTGPYIGRAVRHLRPRRRVLRRRRVLAAPREERGPGLLPRAPRRRRRGGFGRGEVGDAADAEAHQRAPARDAGDDAAADAAPRPSLGDGDVAPAAPAAPSRRSAASPATRARRGRRGARGLLEGLEFLGGLGASEPVLAGFGADLCLTFHGVAATAPDPLRALALYHVERLAQRWKGAHEAALDVAQIEPVEVCDLLAGVVAVARAGAAHASLKMECKAVADRVVGARGRRRAADAFLSADVLGKPIGDVDDSRRRAGRCRAATNAVLCASLAAGRDQGGVEAGSWPTRDGDATSYAAYHAARRARLAGLLKWKRAMEARTIDDDDEGDERARKKRNKQRLR